MVAHASSFSCPSKVAGKHEEAVIHLEKAVCISKASPIVKDDSWFCDDVEDDDDKLVHSKKTKAAGIYQPAFPPFYVVCYRYKNFGSSLTTVASIAPAYILQRNIRI